MPKLIIPLLLFGLVIISGCTKTTQEEEKELPEAIIDRISLVTLEGEKVDIKDFKGKTVFLNFWATWCRPCIAEMPDIDAAAAILHEDDFVFLAASDESFEKIKDYVSQVDYSFTFVRSETSVFEMDIMALPTTMIINKQGEIVYNEVGARKWNSDSEIERLREFTKE